MNKCFLGRILAKRLDVWFFYAFLLTLPLSIRKVLLFYPIKGDFNEYTGIYLYLSDLLLITTLILWGLSILCNNYSLLSRYSFSWIKKWSLSNIWLGLKNNPLITLPIFLVIWSFISIFWSQHQNIALFRSVKLLEFFLLYIYVRNLFHKYENVPPQQECLSTPEMFYVEHLTNQSQIEINSKKEASCGAGVEQLPYGETFLKRFKIFLSIFILIGLSNAFLAFLQIVNNGSIGLKFLKESLFKPDMIGVAKISLWGKVFVRPYGLFPHPNLLGLYILVAVLAIWLYLKLFTARSIVSPENAPIVPQGTYCELKNFWKKLFYKIFGKLFHRCSTLAPSNVPQGTFRLGWNKIKKLLFHVCRAGCSTWNIGARVGNLINQRSIFNLFLLFALIALFLTFSKNAIIGLFIAIFGISYYSFLHSKGCSTLNFGYLKSFFKENVLTSRNILVLAIIFMVFVNIRPSFESLFAGSVNDRLVFQNVSRGTIMDNMFLGVGMGQFVSTMDTYSKMPLLKWQFQPVHNVFSLIWSELGLIGLFIFIWLIWSILKTFTSISIDKTMFHACPVGCSLWNIPSGVKTVFRALLIAFFFMMLFDHYFWDIQQGQALLWIILALV